MMGFLLFEIHITLAELIDVHQSFQIITKSVLWYEDSWRWKEHQEEIFNNRSWRNYHTEKRSSRIVCEEMIIKNHQEVIFKKWTSRSDHEQEILKRMLLNSICAIWILWFGCCYTASSFVSFISDLSLKVTLYDHVLWSLLECEYLMIHLRWSRSLIEDHCCMINVLWSLPLYVITSWRSRFEDHFLDITSWRSLLEDHFLKITSWRLLLDGSRALVRWRLSLLQDHSLISLFHDNVLLSCGKSLWHCVVEQHTMML